MERELYDRDALLEFFEKNSKDDTKSWRQKCNDIIDYKKKHCCLQCISNIFAIPEDGKTSVDAEKIAKNLFNCLYDSERNKANKTN